MIYVHPITLLYTLKFYHIVCQLYLNKTWKKKENRMGEERRRDGKGEKGKRREEEEREKRIKRKNV